MSLYLIPTTLGDSSINAVIPAQVKELVNSIDYYVVEDLRSARRYLRKLEIKKSIDELHFMELNEHTKAEDIPALLNPAKEGKNIGIISDAGCPAIADPGAQLVALAHEQKIKVIPFVGPSSIMLALMASGMNGQNFVFHGYLPVERAERVKKIKAIEENAKRLKQTQIFIETPYRNNHLIEDILKNCNSTTLFCIAADITLSSESISTKSIAKWKQALPDLHKRPAVFLIA